MIEKVIPTSEGSVPIKLLFQEDCTALITLTLLQTGKPVDNAAFTFLRVAKTWYRISFWDRVTSFKLDEPSAPKYLTAEGDFAYQQTDLSPLILAPTVRITDAYVEEGINYTKLVLSLTNNRSIQLRNYWDSCRTQLSII